MELSILIILLLTLYVGIGVIDQISIQAGLYSPLFAAAVTGFLLKDLQTGLIVGATLQLMTLGVATYGGASVPDFLSGAVMGTAFAILSGNGAEYGIGLAVPIGLLLTQLDVLGRMTNTFFQHKADQYAADGDVKGVEMANVLGALPWMLSRMIPVFIGLYFGDAVVTSLNSVIPAWFITGLRAAGSILPAMGMAILMRYLPLKKYYPYYIIGFVMMAYGNSIFSILSVALVGFALAVIHVGYTKPAAFAQVYGPSIDGEVEIDD